MQDIMLELLKNKNKNIYIRYQTIKKLIQYTANENEFEISNSFFIELIQSYFNENYNIVYQNSTIKALYSFFEEIINYYEDNKFTVYYFLLEKYELPDSLKKWLREVKENILGILNYYNKNSFLNINSSIYKNEYFEISQVTKKDCFNETIFPPIGDGINIQLLLEGKMLFKTGIIFKEKEYLLRSLDSGTEKIKILSDSIDLINITLSSKFTKEFNIKKPEDIINMKISKFHLNFLDIIISQNLKQDLFFFFETIILFLKFHDLIENKRKSIAELLYHCDININLIEEKVKQYIRLDIDIIAEYLLKTFDLTIYRLNEIIYHYFKTTFRRYVLQLKIEAALRSFIGTTNTLDSIVNYYSFENSKVFKYHLRKFSNLTIKDLQLIRKKIS